MLVLVVSIDTTAESIAAIKDAIATMEQASRAEDLAFALQEFGSGNYATFRPGAPVADRALVELDFEGESEWFLLASTAGGMSVDVDGTEVTILGPDAPLRSGLMGQSVGYESERPRYKLRTIL